MFIKFLIVVAIYFVNAEAVEIPPDLQEYIDHLHDTCLKKQGLTEDDFKNFDFPGSKDDKLMCYIKCILQEAKWVDDDEIVQYEFIKEDVHSAVRHITLPGLEKCKDVSGEKCEKSYNFYHCMYQSQPEDWFLV